MSKKAKFTAEQITQAATLAAEGMTQRNIAKEMGLSEYLVGKLMREVQVNKAIHEARMTDVIPRKLSEIAEAMTGLCDVVEKLEQRIARTEVVARMTRKALHRLQVENKSTREDRTEAKKELRKLKKDLWKARGY